MNFFLPLLAIISATAIRASDIIFRQTLFSLPSIVIVFLEHGVGLIVLSLLYHKYIKDLRHLTRTQIWAMIWTGVFAGMLATLFYTSGLVLVSFASFSVVVLLQQLQPIRWVIAARLVLKEEITKQFIWLAIIAMIGAYLITFKDIVPNFATGDMTPLAGLFGLLAGVFRWANTAVSKYNLKNLSFQAVTIARYGIAALASLGVIFISWFINSYVHVQLSGFRGSFLMKFVEVKNLSQVVTLEPSQWLNLGWIVIFVGIIGMSLYYRGLQRVPSKVSTMCELWRPFFAFLLDIYYFDRTFTTSQIIGMLLLLSAVLLISHTQKNINPVEALEV